MTNDSEWGEWQTHDGSGCPCVGQWVEAEIEGNKTGRIWYVEGIAGLGVGRSWDWSYIHSFSTIRRYKIRRPKGMAILNAILADLPAPTQPMKTDGVIA